MPKELEHGEIANYSTTPHIYADQLAAIGTGPHVSKLTFGVEDPDGKYPRAVITLVLPTVSLEALAKHIVAALSSEGFRETASQIYLAAAAAMHMQTEQQDRESSLQRTQSKFTGASPKKAAMPPADRDRSSTKR